MIQTITGGAFRRMIISAAAAVENNKQPINELNVFPVPDGDTGTNMSMTINSASADLKKAEDPELYAASKIAASAIGIIGLSIIGTASEEGEVKPTNKARGEK